MKRICLSFLLICLAVSMLPMVRATTEQVTFYSTASDGNIQKTGAEGAGYNVAWDAASGTVQAAINIATVGQYYASMDDYYRIWRSFLFFDTSSLPDNMVIQSAILGIYGSESKANKGFSIVIQNGQPTYPHDPLESGDYDKDNYTEYGGQQYYLGANFTVTDYNNITMNSNGLSWINEIGTTKLCLRSSLDIDGTPPGGTLEWVSFWTFEKGEGYRPKLVVTYTTPLTWRDLSNSAIVTLATTLLPIVYLTGTALFFIHEKQKPDIKEIVVVAVGFFLVAVLFPIGMSFLLA